MSDKHQKIAKEAMEEANDKTFGSFYGLSSCKNLKEAADLLARAAEEEEDLFAVEKREAHNGDSIQLEFEAPMEKFIDYGIALRTTEKTLGVPIRLPKEEKKWKRAGANERAMLNFALADNPCRFMASRTRDGLVDEFAEALAYIGKAPQTIAHFKDMAKKSEGKDRVIDRLHKKLEAKKAAAGGGR
jgi:hypothetical protein